MHSRTSLIALGAFVGLATSSFAQVTFPEAEPNSQKSEATAALGLVSGDLITGTTTGIVTTLGDATSSSVDVFRVKTATAAPGIYLHTLTLTSTTSGNVASVRGVTQTAGAPNPGTDATLQTSNGGLTKWYGFGAAEEIYYRVDGSGASTAPYTATYANTSVTPIAVAGLFNPGPITVTTVGQGHTTDTEIYVYDGNFNPVPLGHNDDIFGVGIGRSTVNVNLLAGTYYVAVANFNTANNQGDANPGENFVIGNLLDFPNAMTNDSTSLNVNVGFSVSDGGTTTPVAATRANAHEVVWGTFTVQVNTNPPANDNCAAAQAIGSGTFGGIITFATNDGAASCDTGGAASRDVWFSFTDPTGSGGVLSADTCGTAGADTVLSVYAACGGSELACNDDCGGAPCAATNSCLTANLAPGQTVKLRVSEKGLGGGIYVLHTSFVGNPPINDSCVNAITIGQGSFPFDTTLATSGESTTGACGGAPVKNVWYSYTATTSGTLTISTCGTTSGTSFDTELWIYQGAGCPVGPSLACNDDATCAASGLNSILTTPVTCGTVYMIEVGNYTFQTTANIMGTFSVTEVGTPCSTPSTAFCAGDAVGTTCVACGNNGAAGRGCANSSFASGTLLSNSGIASVSADTLVLTTTDMTGPGLFFQANGLSGSPIGFGDGMLCAAVGILRLGVVFPTAGSASYPGGLTPNPITVGGGPINAGDLKHYQCWYRDAIAFCTVSTFNTSNGISLTWTP